MTRPTEFGAECSHGHLARSCQTCDMEEEIAALNAKLAAAEARIGRLREALIAHMKWDQLFTPEEENETLNRDGGRAASAAVVETLTRCKEHNDLTDPPTAEGASDGA